ncbi:hypothetical protein [Candidatus Oleimmundimicrobium sp.]|uniref:hypothetical protein n=1 Tax=Candidatus Oleimmundimicrobium sp. TaxID=3060597 RepID=UPI002721B910|nr:hypothetical protein [Candidatus Oleimmundimicrobium sp.]MDO8886567.1 hypothetical protein [Candidatus Oleimmundimicrobium sp.]
MIEKEYTLDNAEKTICQIKEVQAARIVPGEGDTIEEIHVLALPGKAPKQLVRDIESALMASYGLPVDHKKVSIAQVSNGEVTLTKKARPKILNINSELSGVQAKVTVALALDEVKYEGIAKGPASQTELRRLVVLATLDAIEKFMQDSSVFALEDVDLISLGRKKVAVCCISVVSLSEEQLFSGSAIVKQSNNDSVVRATLDAVNRRFGFLKT